MKKTIVCTIIGGLVLMFGLSNFIFGQITVTSSDAPSVPGIYFEMSGADTVTVDLGQEGANQYWDFSDYDFTYRSNWRVVEFNKSPFASRFGNANLVYEVTYDQNDTITYNYVRLTESDLTEVGRGKVVVIGTDTSSVEVAVAKRATPKLNLPATFGDPEWSSVLEVDTLYAGVIQATVVDSSYNQIDAWGTMKTSFGEFPCLRIRQDHSIIVYSSFISIPFERNINYFWVTNTYGILATVTGMSDLVNPPEPNYSTAKSVNIMTNFLTSVQDLSGGIVINEFELFQNYPNPFNPKTTIGYQLNEISDVTLKVFNINGQEVALLVRERQQPGRYEFEWNASYLPSGIYYYQVQANQNLSTQKCLLVK